jgi:sugar transferase (PEP-CTERM/EpsH1 system associated)
LTGDALTVPYYASDELAAWVDTRTAEHGIERVIVFSSAMAQYVNGGHGRYTRKVIDFVDVDSDKWQQYAEKKRWPINWVYRREARRLLAYDAGVAATFDASLFVCSAEAELFRKLVPGVAEKVGYYNNGVDTDYFSPAVVHDNPYPAGARTLVFTGAMDYWPNVDAVVWFAQTLFPLIRESEPATLFYIVGSNPAERVQQLGRQAGVVVTGRVEDVRPYVQHAVAAVAPMRIARVYRTRCSRRCPWPGPWWFRRRVWRAYMRLTSGISYVPLRSRSMFAISAL